MFQSQEPEGSSKPVRIKEVHYYILHSFQASLCSVYTHSYSFNLYTCLHTHSAECTVRLLNEAGRNNYSYNPKFVRNTRNLTRDLWLDNCLLGMFRNHFLSPINPRLSQILPLGLLKPQKNSSPNSIGKQWLRPRPFLMQVKCRKRILAIEGVIVLL